VEAIEAILVRSVSANIITECCDYVNPFERIIVRRVPLESAISRGAEENSLQIAVRGVPSKSDVRSTAAGLNPIIAVPVRGISDQTVAVRRSFYHEANLIAAGVIAFEDVERASVNDEPVDEATDDTVLHNNPTGRVCINANECGHSAIASYHMSGTIKDNAGGVYGKPIA